MANSDSNRDRSYEQQQATLPPPPPTGQAFAPVGAFPGSLTPGWNDPPPLTTENTSNVHGARPRLDLRRRVAYPLDGSSSMQSLNSGAPPAAVTLAAVARPVAKVSPQPSNAPSDQGSSNASENLPPARLPPLAPGNADPSKVPVAKIPPRQK